MSEGAKCQHVNTVSAAAAAETSPQSQVYQHNPESTRSGCSCYGFEEVARGHKSELPLAASVAEVAAAVNAESLSQVLQPSPSDSWTAKVDANAGGTAQCKNKVPQLEQCFDLSQQLPEPHGSSGRCYERSTCIFESAQCRCGKEAIGHTVVHLTQLATFLEMPARALLHAKALLHTTNHCEAGKFQPSWLPSACTSFCDVIGKAGHTHVPLETQKMHRSLKWFAQVLPTQGVSLEESTRMHIGACMPIIATWLCAFCARLDVSTHGHFRSSLAWALQKGVLLTRFALRQEALSELQPTCFARGVFCTSLVAAKLMPCHMLYPEADADTPEWAHVFGHSQGSELPICSLPLQAQQKMCEFIELALKVGLGELKQDCSLFMSFVHKARTPSTAE